MPPKRQKLTKFGKSKADILYEKYFRRSTYLLLNEGALLLMNLKTVYCEFCGTRETPQWRKGPESFRKRSRLCNACGLRFLKESKKI